MHPREFNERLDEAKIAAAICRAELGTSGEIRVCVSDRHRVDALLAARRRFLQLGMARTPLRNAVLIYFAPKARTFALWGDIAVQEKCGDAFWKTMTEKIALHLQADRFAEAIDGTVQEVGAMLARHFPRGSADRNHLPNTVLGD